MTRVFQTSAESAAMRPAAELGIVKNFHDVKVRSRRLVSAAPRRHGVSELGRNSAHKGRG